MLGNFGRQATAKRAYRLLFPTILDMKVDQFALEFANRELAEYDLWKELGSEKELAAGVIDVKNHYVETPQDVAERIRPFLKVVDPARLTLTPDCGFSQTARFVARAKLKAMVTGTEIVRRELGV